jgi:hypothetical protein
VLVGHRVDLSEMTSAKGFESRTFGFDPMRWDARGQLETPNN